MWWTLWTAESLFITDRRYIKPLPHSKKHRFDCSLARANNMRDCNILCFYACEPACYSWVCSCFFVFVCLCMHMCVFGRSHRGANLKTMNFSWLLYVRQLLSFFQGLLLQLSFIVSLLFTPTWKIIVFWYFTLHTICSYRKCYSNLLPLQLSGKWHYKLDSS